MTHFIGDKTQFLDAGLEEATTSLYICPVCGAEKDIVEEFENGNMYPVRFLDLLCTCGSTLDKK